MIGEIYEGMTVRSPDGSKLGKIEKLGDGTFTIEKGLLSKERHEARFEDVTEIRDGDAIVNLGAESSAGERKAAASTAGEIRVPLAEEELEVARREREAGEVEVRKEVHTEEKQMTVPVRHEEVIVERTAATGKKPAEGAFEDESFTIPVHEEEVEIRKRPVVREEVRVATADVEEQRSVREPVRREEAHVETSGDVERAPTRGDPSDGRW